MTGPTYLKFFFGSALFILMTVAAINYIVDPYGIYHFGKSWDWIDSRPELEEMTYLHKASDPGQENADVLFLGNSRVAKGIDPSNPVIPGQAYNLALSGGAIYESWRYLQNATVTHLPKIIVLGTDIGTFAYTRVPDPTFSEARLKVQPDGKPTPYYRWNDTLPTLFSLNALEASIKAIRWSLRRSHIQYKQGFEPQAPALIDRMNLASRVFAANRKWFAEATTKPVPYRSINGNQPQMDAFEHIVSFCAEHHIRLIVFILPVHGKMFNHLTTDWDAYGDWMKAVTKRMENQPNLQWEFWDFQGYNSITTEPFPKPTDEFSTMHYFWEGSHFRTTLGDLILERIFANKGPDSFGYRITSATLDQDLARLKSEKEAWNDRGVVSPP